MGGSFGLTMHSGQERLEVKSVLWYTFCLGEYTESTEFVKFQTKREIYPNKRFQ